MKMINQTRRLFALVAIGLIVGSVPVRAQGTASGMGYWHGVTAPVFGDVSANTLCLDATNKDTCLSRLAADTLGLRRGPNAQELQIGPSGSPIKIISEAAGGANSGTIRTLGNGSLYFGAGDVSAWYIDWSSKALLANGAYNMGDGAGNSPPVVNVETAFRTDAGASYNLAAPFAIRTAPTISSGFGTSPSIVASNGTAAFTINVGTGGTANSGVIGFPAATTGWAVQCMNTSTNTATVFLTKQTATTTTTATIGNYDAAGAAAAWVASNVLVCLAIAF